jgi:hypothetical protein
MMFYGLSRFPQYAESLNVFIALAPVAWVAQCRVPLLQVMRLAVHCTVSSVVCVAQCRLPLLRVMLAVHCTPLMSVLYCVISVYCVDQWCR